MLYGLAGLPHHYPMRGFGSSPPYCGSVRELQQKLQNVGLYQGTVDGQWGPKTQAAAQQFAQQHGISVGGGISQAYCNALDAAQGGASAPASSSTTSGGGGGGGGQQELAEQTDGSSVTPDQGTGSGVGGWWSSQSTGVKVAIVGGGVLVLGLVGLMVFGGKAPAPVMVKNRRRRRARR